MPLDGSAKIGWGAQDVRATIFSTEDLGRLDDLFAFSFGQRCQQYNEAVAGMNSPMAQAVGQGELGQFVLARAPGRFDLYLQPAPSPSFGTPPGADPNDIQHPLIQDVISALSQIEKAAQNIITKMHSIDRLAVAIFFAKPAATVEQANNFLGELLPYGIRLHAETDFLLQNNFVETAEDGLTSINSFSTWRVTPVQQINVLSTVNNSFSGPAQIINAYYLAQKMIDINTVSQPRKYNAAQALPIHGALLQRLQTLMTIT